MAEVASRLLRNDTRGLLRRVQQGESITITVDGLPVATLQPLAARPTWMPRSAFISGVLFSQADTRLTADLRELAPDTTDDLPL